VELSAVLNHKRHLLPTVVKHSSRDDLVVQGAMS